MNGAIALLSPTMINNAKRTITMINGTSQDFLRARKNRQISARNDT